MKGRATRIGTQACGAATGCTQRPRAVWSPGSEGLRRGRLIRIFDPKLPVGDDLRAYSTQRSRPLKDQPYDLEAVEALMRAHWRTGDVQGAIKWVEQALRLNPHEPGYRYVRGLLRQAVGMFREALEDFEGALAVAKSCRLRASLFEALRALEDWQLLIVEILLAEDRAFRLAFSADPDGAVRARGFALTKSGQEVLLAISARGVRRDAAGAFAGLS